MAKIQKGGFDDPRNYDNVFNRSVIAGLLSILNDNVYIQNINEDGVEYVKIPFFPNHGGNSRFMQDFFFFGQKCIYPKLADGNYDQTPRGIITLVSKTIDQQAMTHRFVRARFVRNVGGELREFNAYTNSIPIASTIEVEIKTDTYLDLMKIEQAIIETFYKTQVYSIYYKGFKVPAQVGFPEDYGAENLFEYSHPDNKEIKLSFVLEVATYQPVTDGTSEMPDNKRILYFSGARSDDEPFVKLIDTNPLTTYPGADIIIKWDTTGDILNVNITYTLDDTEYKIDTARPNNGLMVWTVPYINRTATVYLLNIGHYVHKEAVLHPRFNDSGELVDIIIVDGGIGYSELTTVEIDEPNFAGTKAQAQPLLTNGTIVGFNIISAGVGYTPSETSDITIKVESSRFEDASDTWDNIEIY